MLGKPVFTNKIVAKTLDIDESKVENVMNFFYKELDKELYECNHTFLFVRGLGTFGINSSSLDKRLRILYKQIRKLSPNLKKRDVIIKAIREEMFYLFDVRRKVRTRKNTNKLIKKYGKSFNDIEG